MSAQLETAIPPARIVVGSRVIHRDCPEQPAERVLSVDGDMVVLLPASGRGLTICHAAHLLPVPDDWEDAPHPPRSALSRLEAQYDGPMPADRIADAHAFDRGPGAALVWAAFHRLHLTWVRRHLIPLDWSYFDDHLTRAEAAVTAARVRVDDCRAAAPVLREMEGV